MITPSDKLLLDSPPLVVQKELAVALESLDKAVVLQQLHYLTRASRQSPKGEFKHKNGYWWVFNSYGQWKEDHFPFWSESKIGRIFRDLEDQGLVVSAKFGAHKYDQRKWYRIDYDALDSFLSSACTMEDTNLARSSASDCNDQACQPDTIMSKTTTKTTTIEEDQPAQTGEKETEATETAKNILNPTGESAGERKKRELQEKFGTDPVAHAVQAAQGEPGKRKTRPRGWEDATDDEWRIIQRVAALWTGGKLPWGDKVESNILAAGAILDLYGGDTRAAIKALDEYNSLHGGEFTVIGPASLVNSMMAYRANGGKSNGKNGTHYIKGSRYASLEQRGGKEVAVLR